MSSGHTYHRRIFRNRIFGLIRVNPHAAPDRRQDYPPALSLKLQPPGPEII